MGYLHINNLYKEQLILLFKECYALEKIHGTSAHVGWDGKDLKFFSGGESHEKFITLFNAEDIKTHLINCGFGNRKVVIYGEAYGGKCQKMSETYGPNLKFIAFDVCLDDANWLNVPEAEAFCTMFGIEFVPYVKVSTNLKELDFYRDAFSVQAIRNGVTKVETHTEINGEITTDLVNPKKREGIVLRPLIELVTSTGNRVICKHKGDDFRETASPRVVEDPNKLAVLADAEKIGNEWVTMTRLEHVLDKIPDHGMDKMVVILNAMIEDVTREAAGEIVDNDVVRKTIKAKTVSMYRNYLRSKIGT
jgi:hypothetical protein